MSDRSYRQEQLGIIRIEAKRAVRGFLDVGVKNPYAKGSQEHDEWNKGIEDAYKEAGI